MQVADKAIAQAVAELGVDVPVLRVEVHGAGLRLWLYGGQGEPVVWEPKAKAKPRAGGTRPRAGGTRKKEAKK